MICKGCGQEIVRRPPPARDYRSLYCNNACKMRERWRTHEKKVYPPSEEKRLRDAENRAKRLEALHAKRAAQKVEAQRKAQERRLNASAATLQRRCKVCGASFIRPLYRSGMWNICFSEECRLKAKRESRRKMRQGHGTKPGERARRRGLPFERCGAIAVCTRDRWRCQLCGVSTPRSLRGTYDMLAPEVDHIIPLAHPQSPGHVWANVQCLCRRCNLKKSNKPLGQLRLAV